MENHLLIRDATASDQDAIQAVTLAAYEEYAHSMPPPIWNGYRQNILATLAHSAPAEQIVAERGGIILGSVLLYPPVANAYSGAGMQASWPEVRLLAVLPSARGQGVGAALMRECARRARLAGATSLGLHTMDMMQAAMHLYERLGFQRAPAYDFQPAEGIVIKGFYLPLT
jgi:predicted N-acetyltransferase YhbS